METALARKTYSSVFYSWDKQYRHISVHKLFLTRKRSSESGFFYKNNRLCVDVPLAGLLGPEDYHSLLHPSPESAHLTCSSNLVITAWTHSTGLWAAMAGRRDTAALCWLIQGARPELTRLFLHESLPWIDGWGPQGRVFFPFCRIHHATAMTHHRKSSSEKLMGVLETRVKLAAPTNTTSSYNLQRQDS